MGKGVGVRGFNYVGLGIGVMCGQCVWGEQEEKQRVSEVRGVHV